VALDDERATFHPVMWDEREEIEPGVLAMPLEAGRRDARIEQVWFAGVHSNVGGGYTKQGLSLVSLDWMMKKAEDHGLQFLPVRQTFRELGNVNDTLYDSRSGLAIYYGYKPRDMAHLCSEAVPRVHISVFERIWNGTADYAPGPMPEGVQVVSTYGDVHHGENAVSLEHIGGIVTAAHRARHSAIPWIWTRRVAHMTLLAVTAFVGVFAWFTVPLPGAGDGGHAGSEAGVDYLAALAVEIWALMSAGIAGLAGVLWQIGRDPRLFLPMLAVLVAVWLVSRTAKRHIQGRYSRFWRELCAQTRNERSPADALRARVGR
jgi:hypothetical protein